MRRSNSFFGAIRDFFSRKKAETNAHKQGDLGAIMPHLMTLGRGEVMLKRSLGKETFDVFTIEELTPEQLDMLARGEITEGLTAYYI